MKFSQNILLTAFSKWVRAKSMFFVCVNNKLPICRWVLASICGGGLNWRIDCKQWMQCFILGGLAVLKVSLRPNKAMYQESVFWCWLVAIFYAHWPSFFRSLFTSKFSLWSSATSCWRHGKNGVSCMRISAVHKVDAKEIA